MKRAIFLLIVFFINFPIFAQTLVEKGKVWSIFTIPCENYPVYSYYLKVGEDTLVNDLKYQKLLISSDSLQTNWTLNKLIRQEGSKVLYRNNFSDEEIVLYDFGVNEGDSFLIGGGFKLKVDSIRGISGQRHFYLSGFWQNTIWIEGVGCIAGLLENHGGINVYGAITHLLCCNYNNTLLYKNQDYSNCFITTYISSFKNRSYLLSQNFPNPFSNSTQISVELNSVAQNAYLNIYNVCGFVVKKIKIEKSGLNTIVLNSSELSKGVYYYNLSIGEEWSESKKLICF